MGDITINQKNVITQSGTAEPVLASNVSLASATFPAGTMVKFEFQRTNNTQVQEATTSYTAVSGSSRAYTPVAGATYVYYSCKIGVGSKNERTIMGFQISHDGSYLDYSRITTDTGAIARAPGADFDNATGWSYFNTIIPAWSGAKTTLLAFREYSASYTGELHSNHMWKGTDGGEMNAGAIYLPTEVTMYSIM